MLERVSALDGHYRAGRYGRDGETGVSLQLVRDLQLVQVAAWPDSMDSVGKLAAAQVAADDAPAPGRAVETDSGAIMRIEPLKWWLFGVTAPDLTAEQGASLDISHSRTMIRINGDQAAVLLNRLVSLDLREQSFPAGSVASTFTHHVGVTLWRSSQGYELLIPRGFALSVWEVLLESSMQFGVTVI